MSICWFYWKLGCRKKPKSAHIIGINRASNSWFSNTTCLTPPAEVSIKNFYWNRSSTKNIIFSRALWKRNEGYWDTRWRIQRQNFLGFTFKSIFFVQNLNRLHMLVKIFWLLWKLYDKTFFYNTEVWVPVRFFIDKFFSDRTLKPLANSNKISINLFFSSAHSAAKSFILQQFWLKWKLIYDTQKTLVYLWSGIFWRSLFEKKKFKKKRFKRIWKIFLV